MNNTFTNATTITGIPATVTGTNVDATMQTGEPDHGGMGAATKSAWWTWTSPVSDFVTISTAGSAFDTLLGVYTGSAVNALTHIASADDSGDIAPQSRVDFNAVAGTTYKIAVAGYNGASGAINLSISMDPPPNDNFAAATELPSGIYPASASSPTYHATAEVGENTHAGQTPGKSVWWKWSATSNARIRVHTYDSSFDTVLSVYTGAGYPLTEIVSNDDSPITTSGRSMVTFNAVAGTLYYFAVDGKAGAVGTAGIQVESPPQNDDLADAIELVGVTASQTTFNFMATPEVSENSHAGFTPENSVWWKWVAPNSGPATINTVGGEIGIDTVLGVYTGTAFPLTQIASDDNGFGANGWSTVTFNAVAGTTYYIAADTLNWIGFVKVNVCGAGAPPANDNFANAQAITSGDVLNVSTGGATAETNENEHFAGIPASRSVWYTWTAPANGSGFVYTNGSDYNTVLGVYTGTTLPLTPVGNNNDYQGLPTSRIAFSVIAGTTYYFAVDSATAAFGNATVHFDFALGPINDNFANAITLTGVPVNISAHNNSATEEFDEPNHAGKNCSTSVWYTWTVPATGGYSIDTIGSSFDTILGVYTGSEVGLLTAFKSNDDISVTDTNSRVQFYATAGTTYKIAVDAVLAITGNFNLNINTAILPPPPVNDNLANATVITGYPASVDGTNAEATAELGEPNHAGETVNSSVWWTWTAPISGNVRIDTFGSSFDTLLAVYTGSSYPLSLIISNDEAPAPAVNVSRVTFSAVAGTTYKIAVDGYLPGAPNNIGTIMLNIVPNAAPGNNNFANAFTISSLPATIIGSNFSATRQSTPAPGEPQHAGVNGVGSVWWKWTATFSGPVSISTVGSNFDTLLAVYTGSAVQSLTHVASDDQSGGNSTSQLTFNAVSGTTYQIAVDGSVLSGSNNRGTIRMLVRSIVPPQVSTATTAETNPTSATTVQFTVGFSEAVTGVDLTDFDLVTSPSVTGASVAGVTGTGTTYTVTVNTGTGEGGIQLHVLDNDSIQDLQTDLLVGAVNADGQFYGQIYTIDRTVPVLNTLAAVDAKNLDVTFTEEHGMGPSALSALNYTVSGAGQGSVSSHPNSVAHLSGNTYRLTWTSGNMANGQSISLEVNSVHDHAGNAIAPSSSTNTTALPVGLSGFMIE